MDNTVRILLVEDSDLDHELLVRHFATKANFKALMHRVETLAEFEVALSDSWDAIISDYNVPGFGALPALNFVKARGLDIPLIVVSGEVGEENAVEIMHAGADDFVRKDNLSRLVPALERSINAGQLRRRKAKLRIAHEKALQDRERLMDVVCHDLKNPLSSIRLGCQLLISKGKSIEKLESGFVSEITEGILRSSERIDRLVRDLLEQSRIEAGLFGIQPRKIFVAEFLVEVLEAFRPIASNKGVGLRIQTLTEKLEGYFDKDRIFQVIGNLVSNAIKFSPAGSEVVIGVEPSVEGGLRFFVDDCGTGIPDEEKANIFTRFYQGKSHKYKGNGLGLWIAQEIVHAHKGQIGFKPSSKDVGTTFWFFIPPSKEMSVKASPAAARLADLQRRVLIVDDDEDLSLAICKIFKDKEVPCRIANGYEAAVIALQQEPWTSEDVLFVDYDLPGKSGGDLIEWARSYFSSDQLPLIVLMSAHPDVDERAKELQVLRCVRKPMNLAELFEIVEGDTVGPMPLGIKTQEASINPLH